MPYVLPKVNGRFYATYNYYGDIMIFKRIRDLREDKDWTQQKVADMLFINRRTYSAYENGVNAVPIEILIKISKIHNVSVDYILCRTDNPEINK